MLVIPQALKNMITEVAHLKLGVDITDPEAYSLIEVQDHGYNRYTFAYKTVPLGLFVQMNADDTEVIEATFNK